MGEWFNDTLVALILYGKRYKVIELPARQTSIITSKRSFATIEQAEAYIADQYPQAIYLQGTDLEEERQIRREFLSISAYTLITKPFQEVRVKVTLPEISENEALRHYKAAASFLMLTGGGYVALYEEDNAKYPIRAQRVGYPR